MPRNWRDQCCQSPLFARLNPIPASQHRVLTLPIVEGELPDDGLAGLDADDHDQVLALAKRLVDPDAADDASLEAMFAATRALEAEAEEALDEAHRLGAEPMPSPAQLVAAMPPPEPALPDTPVITTATPPARRAAQLTLDLIAGTPSAAPPGDHDGAGPAVPPIGQVVRFENLAALARPRARRRKAAPVGQLDLFAS